MSDTAIDNNKMSKKLFTSKKNKYNNMIKNLLNTPHHLQTKQTFYKLAKTYCNSYKLYFTQTTNVAKISKETNNFTNNVIKLMSNMPKKFITHDFLMLITKFNQSSSEIFLCTYGKKFKKHMTYSMCLQIIKSKYGKLNELLVIHPYIYKNIHKKKLLINFLLKCPQCFKYAEQKYVDFTVAKIIHKTSYSFQTFRECANYLNKQILIKLIEKKAKSNISDNIIFSIESCVCFINEKLNKLYHDSIPDELVITYSDIEHIKQINNFMFK